MATRESYVHNSMETFSGASRKISFMQFSQNIDGFRRKDSQDFKNSYNSINRKFSFSLFTKTIHWL